MGKSYTTAIEVRGYELDSFGHVNHANYLKYLEYARWKMLEEEKISMAVLRGWGRFPVIANLDIRYLRPLFMGDQIVVETKLVDYKRSSTFLHQEIRRSEKPVAEAKIRSVIVDTNGRPAELPEEMERTWKRILTESKGSAE